MISCCMHAPMYIAFRICSISLLHFFVGPDAYKQDTIKERENIHVCFE